jgi:hypothetical protein
MAFCSPTIPQEFGDRNLLDKIRESLSQSISAIQLSYASVVLELGLYHWSGRPDRGYNVSPEIEQLDCARSQFYAQ